MRRLFIKANTSVTTSNPAKYHIYLKKDDGSEQQILFAGFSYYGEIAGLRVPPADRFVQLSYDFDPPNENWQAALADDTKTIVKMTYGQWIRFLSDHKINHSRIFCFPEVACAVYPIHRYGATAPPLWINKYDLNLFNTLYTRVLTRYLELARRKGIVVQISFASVQSLRDAPGVDDWNEHPFNKKNNINGFIDAPDGRTQFCDIASHPNYLAAEKRMVEGIVNAAKPYWNVMFELFNEPFPNLTGVVDWHRQVATWVHNLLRDPTTGERSHLVTFNAPAELLDPLLPGGSILAKLLMDGAGNRLPIPLVDAYQFHGNQWGGDSGTRDCASRPQAPGTAAAITEATRNAVNAFYDRWIDAGHRFKVAQSRVAIICDADAHSKAQDRPDVYGAAAFGLELSYVHRWMDCYLTQGKVKSQADALAAVVPPGVSPPPDTMPAPPPPDLPSEPIEV